jgi:hypothetical protein
MFYCISIRRCSIRALITTLIFLTMEFTVR